MNEETVVLARSTLTTAHMLSLKPDKHQRQFHNIELLSAHFPLLSSSLQRFLSRFLLFFLETCRVPIFILPDQSRGWHVLWRTIANPYETPNKIAESAEFHSILRVDIVLQSRPAPNTGSQVFQLLPGGSSTPGRRVERGVESAENKR